MSITDMDNQNEEVADSSEVHLTVEYIYEPASDSDIRIRRILDLLLGDIFFDGNEGEYFEYRDSQ